MDATKHSNDFKVIDSTEGEIQSSHWQPDSIASNSQSEVLESIDSSSIEAQSLAVASNDLLLDSTPSKAQLVEREILLNENAQVANNLASNLGQSSYDPQAGFVENPQVVDNFTSNLGQSTYDPQVPFVEDPQAVNNFTSNLGQSSYDPQVSFVENPQVVDNFTSNLGQSSYNPQVARIGPSSLGPNNSFTYNGVTYYSHEAFQQDMRRQLLREMQMDGVAPRSDDNVDEPQFSDSMVLATGGSHAVINPYNGLPWRKGANLCRPYMEEGCCRFGTACIFHHPWPPIEELP